MSKKTKTNFVTNFAGLREKMWYHLLRGVMQGFQNQTSWQTMAQTVAERNNEPQLQEGQGQ